MLAKNFQKKICPTRKLDWKNKKKKIDRCYLWWLAFLTCCLHEFLRLDKPLSLPPLSFPYSASLFSLPILEKKKKRVKTPSSFPYKRFSEDFLKSHSLKFSKRLFANEKFIDLSFNNLFHGLSFSPKISLVTWKQLDGSGRFHNDLDLAILKFF